MTLPDRPGRTVPPSIAASLGDPRLERVREERPTPRRATADEVPAPPAGVVHRWTVTADAPPAAWAALQVDVRALIAVAAKRGIVLAGPEGAGSPQLTADRIALAVKVGAKGFSSPFVFTRTAGPGQAVTTLGAMYDGLVLAALARAGRHLGALLTVSTDAGPEAAAIGARLVDLVFGDADRSLQGVDPLSPRAQVEQVVGGYLDAIDNPDDPRDVTELLGSLAEALQAEHDGRVSAEAG